MRGRVGGVAGPRAGARRGGATGRAGGEAAPLHGAERRERTAAGPGARPRGCSGRRWPRPPGPGRRPRPWTAGAVCGRCWRRRSGCVSAAGSGGARGRGDSGCARSSRGAGPARWRRGGGPARPARPGRAPAGGERGRGGLGGAAPLPPLAGAPRAERRGAYLLGPGRGGAALLCAPPSPPRGERAGAGRARCAFGERPLCRGLCCGFPVAFSETVGFVSPPRCPRPCLSLPGWESPVSCPIPPLRPAGPGRKRPRTGSPGPAAMPGTVTPVCQE